MPVLGCQSPKTIAMLRSQLSFVLRFPSGFQPFFLLVKKTPFVGVLALFSVLPAVAQPSPQRIPFTLKNNLGHHRMFRVEGPGIAYGFTMNRNERTEKSWPVGAKLYFSTDGERTEGLLFTVDPGMAGRIVPVFHSGTGNLTGRAVRLRFRNNSLWFKKVALITYKPDEQGNETNIVTLAPYASLVRHFPIGTRVYFASDPQVAVVMSGKPLRDEPFLVVSAEDDGTTFPIFK